MTDREVANLLDKWEFDQWPDREFKIREAAYVAASNPRISDPAGLDFAWMGPISYRALSDPTRTVEFQTINLRVPRWTRPRERILLCEHMIREHLKAHGL